MPPMLIDPKKLGPDEAGDLRLQITAKDGAVFFHFGAPVTWFGIPNEEAIGLAKVILKQAGVKSVKLIL